MYHYTVNALYTLPAFGKHAGGRGTCNGSFDTNGAATEEQLKTVVANWAANKAGQGCDPNGITFIEFSYTELAAGWA
ncbi:hypothetical protein [Streptomyces malaysiensis]|uniref:hypothetical protein n=1 Tax=Streptomyces malaysiensis TaxID=92644 RepID=UPI0036A3ED9B